MINIYKLLHSAFFYYSVFAGYTLINSPDEYFSPQIPKMVFNKNEELIYTSRSPIPSNKDNTFTESFKQVCVYGFTKKALEKYSTLSSGIDPKNWRLWLDQEDLLECDLVDLILQWRKIICVVAQVKYRSQNISSITLVEIPIVSDADFDFLDLYICIYVLFILNKIRQELHPSNNFIQKMLKWANYITLVVLVLRILFGYCGLK